MPMLYVLTVHWQHDRWVEIQTGHVRRHGGDRHRIHACVTGVGSEHRARFDRVIETDIVSHGEKLNLLAADAIERGAGPDDVLVFLDGDAFPIAPLVPKLERYLAEFPLVAIRRDESAGDPQPHPAFCAMPVRVWQELDGDWTPGHQWQLGNGRRRTDVGGNLLREIERRDLRWRPLLRTGGLGAHGMYFGVYDGWVYHHGAGFRPPYSTYDLMQSRYSRTLYRLTPNRCWRHVSRLLEPTRRTTLRNAAESERVHLLLRSGDDPFAGLVASG